MRIATFVAKKLYKEQGESSGDSKQYFFPEILVNKFNGINTLKNQRALRA